MLALTATSALLLLTALFASGFADFKHNPRSPVSLVGDTVPREQYVAMKRLAAKRLRGWRKSNLIVLKQRRTVRALARQHGTGIPALDQALCLHSFESIDWHQKGHHRGGMQFLFSTWRSAGGRGDPADAHPIEQLYRAFLVYSRDGGWREWSTAPLCGLR